MTRSTPGPGPDAARPERLRGVAPVDELERRWAAVRAAMTRDGVDALLVHSHVDNLGGSVRWFCDLGTSGGYPLSVVFPRDGAMTVVMHGPHDAVRDLPPDNPLVPGVGRIATTWSFASAAFTATYDARALVGALRPYAGGRIGVVGAAQLPYPLRRHLEDELPSVELIDAADLVDPIKAVKSPWEQAALRQTLTLQKAAFDAALDAIAPGRREWEIAAEATAAARRLGGDAGVVMIGSAPRGEPAALNPPRHQNRTLRAGDRIALLIEPGGVDGYFGEVGRMIALGPADDATLREHELALAAWRHTVDALRPGVAAAAVFAAHGAFLQAAERPPEQRLHAHGQGYDLVERPLVRSDETMTLAAGMFLSVHPMWVAGGEAAFLCDNVLLGPDGATGPLHGVAQRVFEV